MQPTLEQLVRLAEAHASNGRWPEARQVWQQLHQRAPEHPKALYGLGFHALQANDFRGAQGFLEATVRQVPKDLLAWMTLATVYKELQLGDQELQAIEAALRVEPYCLPALLLKSAWMERRGHLKDAAANYANALKIAPPRSQWPAALKSQLQHAERVVGQRQDRYARYLDDLLAPVRAGLPAGQLALWQEAISIFSGKSHPYQALSNQLHVPRLPAQPFFERSQFPWLADLEAETAVIRAELEAALKAGIDRFSPYIAYRPGDPVNQWAELNHSARWSALHLWRGGVPVAENLSAFPRTAEILAALPLAQIGGLCPNVLFSALAPKTRIPPHHGETNARLVAHLPLIVPPDCGLRVGFEQRSWTPGETLIFDDTLEHEAHNHSDELRVVLIFDLWNPLLSLAEREVVQAMAAAARTFPG